MPTVCCNVFNSPIFRYNLGDGWQTSAMYLAVSHSSSETLDPKPSHQQLPSGLFKLVFHSGLLSALRSGCDHKVHTITYLCVCTSMAHMSDHRVFYSHKQSILPARTSLRDNNINCYSQ